jgi:hypothetical protein
MSFKNITSALYGNDSSGLKRQNEINLKIKTTREQNWANKDTEYHLTVRCIKWLNIQYPGLFYDVDFQAMMKLSVQQRGMYIAVTCKEYKRPDVMLYHRIGQRAGLCIEMKKESPFMKTDKKKLLKDEHNEIQNESMLKLESDGYVCTFCWDFDQFQLIVNRYMKSEPVPVWLQR